MYWRDIVFLCKDTETIDSLGRPQKSGYVKREVTANVKGVKRTEFYQAQTAGYRPEISVELKEIEYERERYLEINGIMYKVIRSYPVTLESVELVCEGLVDGNG